MKFILLILLSWFYSSYCTNISNHLHHQMGHGVNIDEIEQLKTNLFNNYDPNIIPKEELTGVSLNISIELNTLEEFNQISETIVFNLWITKIWYDYNLKWDVTDYNGLSNIIVKSEQIWTPDLELYNAASYPKIYSMNNGIKLYNNGTLEWISPVTFAFTCPLNLIDFPFDSQSCEMDFGSWKFSKDYIDIMISSTNNFTLNPSFSHNEWDIMKMTVTKLDTEYKCCPGELWPVITYKIDMTRKYAEYTIKIIMTIIMTFTAIIINNLNYKKYIRTYLLVFIPLTIIWLLLSIITKIPVIGYFTKMDTLLLTSFLCCQICTVISGVLFCIHSNYLPILYKYIKVKNCISEYPIFIDKYYNGNLIVTDETIQNYNLYYNYIISRNINKIDKSLNLIIFLGYIIFIVCIYLI